MPANPADYLAHVSAGTCRDAGLKRPTFASVSDAAKALALPVTIATASRGYAVNHAAGPDPCRTLADVAACLLRIHHNAWRLSPAGKASAAARMRARAAAGRGPMAPHVAAALGCAERMGFATPNPETEAWAEPLPADCYPPARRPVLPGETLPPAPVPARGSEPDLPELPTRFACRPGQGQTEPWAKLQPMVSYSQQQQQPQQAPAAPAPVVAPGPRARRTAPARMPADVAGLLQRFGLTLDGLLTEGLSNAKLAKGAATAWPVILHHLPARSLRQAVAGAEPGPTAPRSRLPGLAELARRNGLESLALAHNGCPWASDGCRDGCLAWAGHGGLSQTVAAARARRTLAFLWNPKGYAVAVLWAIARAWARAQAKGLPLAVRLRGTDDLPWHDLRFTLTDVEAATLARRYGLPVVPGMGTTIPEALSLAPAGTLALYEYSAAPVDGPLGLLAQQRAGIDVTASLKADRPGGLAHGLQAVAAGFRLAVPVAIPKGQPLPPVLLLRNGDTVARLLTVDGDITDHRWLDPAGPQPGGFDGVAVLLRTKRSRGRGPAAAAFSLAPTIGEWQPLAGGGHAALSLTTWQD